MERIGEGYVEASECDDAKLIMSKKKDEFRK